MAQLGSRLRWACAPAPDACVGALAMNVDGQSCEVVDGSGFDPFSGDGADLLELVWEPCVSKYKMSPPLTILCVSQGDDVSVSVMRLEGPGDRDVARATEDTSFKSPLVVIIVDQKNAVAKASISADGILGAVIGPL
jgi:hypothetical protein